MREAGGAVAPVFGTKESSDGGITLLTVKGKQAANCFRAWISLDDGIRAWLQTIASAYGETLPSLLAGNGAAWASAIGPSARPGRSCPDLERSL